MRNYYVAGEWNAICMRCGFKHKASELKQEWTGLRVCDDCFETRHPQTMLRVLEERNNIPWTSPEPSNLFIPGIDNISTENYIPLVLETNSDLQILTEG